MKRALVTAFLLAASYVRAGENPGASENPDREHIAAAMAAITHADVAGSRITMSQHDAFIFFSSVGYKEAVPSLIKALSEVEYTEKDGTRWYVCTWVHLQEALEAQTGKHFSLDQAAWQKWWDSEGKDLPESFFDPKKHQKPEANRVAGGD